MWYRTEQLRMLQNEIILCKKCPGLNIPTLTESCPGYGNIDSPIFIVGMSLCGPCMKTQVPFTGGSGEILDIIFEKLGVVKKDLYISNLVHCHPPKNRPSTEEEIKNCLPYLLKEIELVNPLLLVFLGSYVRTILLPYTRTWQLFYHSNGKFQGRHTLNVFHPAFYLRRSLNSQETRAYINYMYKTLRRWV